MLEKSKDADNGERGFRREGRRIRDGEEGFGRTEVMREGRSKKRGWGGERR